MKGNGQHAPSGLNDLDAVTRRMAQNKRMQDEKERRDFLGQIDLNAIEIEDAVPLPPIGTPKRAAFSLPFDKLAIGQSFWIPWPADAKFSHSGAASRRMRPKRFSSRRAEKDGKPGVRVWRTA